jgi:acyl transferase domain-containing protein
MIRTEAERSGTALMFPGLGSDFAAPFAHYAPGRRIATELARQVDAVGAAYGWPSVLTDPTPRSWHPVQELRTYHLQLCCRRILQDELGFEADIVVGHSLGEITSLVVAGGVTVEDGALLLCERNRALAAHASQASAAAAFMVSSDEARELARKTGGVVVAAVNSPTQTILSGPQESILRLVRLANTNGISATRLRTGPYPQHHPDLEPAFQRYHESVRGIRQRPLRIDVHSTILGRRLEPDDDLVAVATLQMVRPLNFARAVRELQNGGIRLFVECGLKDTLSRLVTEILGDGARVYAPFRKRVTQADIQNLTLAA